MDKGPLLLNHTSHGDEILQDELCDICDSTCQFLAI